MLLLCISCAPISQIVFSKSFPGYLLDIRCLEKTLSFSSTRFFAVRFVAKRCVHPTAKKCLNGQIGTCLLGTRWYNF